MFYGFANVDFDELNEICDAEIDFLDEQQKLDDEEIEQYEAMDWGDDDNFIFE